MRLPYCEDCGMRHYGACEEEMDGDLYSLSETPEGLGLETVENSPDPRDRTPEPPAYLDPHFILRNRARVRLFVESGEFTWPRDAA